MIFATFDGFCHQLSVALQIDRNSITFDKASKNIKSTTFYNIKFLENWMNPIRINFGEKRKVINKTLERLYENRNKKVHRTTRSYKYNISIIDTDFRFIYKLVKEIQESLAGEFEFNQKVV